MSVLVVEDETTARKAIARILRQQNFAVLEAGTVAQALARLADQPRWVLLDLMLPDGCGSEVLARVKAEQLPAEVCVITGCVGPRLEQVRAMGANHVFLKPVDVDRLISLLREPSSAHRDDEVVNA